MQVFIKGYNFNQKDYPVSDDISINEATISLAIEIIEYNKQITPEQLSKILHDTQEFYEKKYNKSYLDDK